MTPAQLRDKVASHLSRPRARRGEGDRTREAIVAAADELLTESGSEEAVSIRAVADRVGLTAPAIYRHFPDKAHLIFEVCARHFDAMYEEAVAPVIAGTDDPVEALAAIGRAYVRFGIENPEHYRVMFMGHADHAPEMYAAERVLDTGALGTTIALVQRGLDEGRLRADAGDAVTLTWVLWTTLHGIVTVAVAKPNMPGPPLDVQVEAAIDVMFHGMLA